MSAPAVAVHALACRAAVAMARRGFASLARHSDRPIHFVVHDDGSLQDDDYRVLSEAVPDTTFVTRQVADGLVDAKLSRYPVSRAFRRANPLALKLLDIPLLATGGDVAVCDTDVLAFAPFAGVFDWPDAATTGLFMPDSQNAYAIRPWHLVAPGIALPMHVNTGLMLFRTGHHDLDFIEWFLGRQLDVYRRIPGWVEQTCWAALAQRGQTRLYDAAQVRVVRDPGCLSDDALLIGHFTSNVRNLWDRPSTERPSSGAPAVVRTHPTRRLSSTRLAAEQARRLAARGRRWIQARAR